MTTESPSIVVLGAGAMGCFFGAALSRSGGSITLVDDWAEHLDAIEHDGLVVRAGRHTRREWPRCRHLDEPGTVADVVLLLCKARDTERYLAASGDLIGPRTCLVTLQNGLGNIERLQRVVPAERLVAGVTTYSAELLRPGVVRSHPEGYLWMGPAAQPPSRESTTALDVFGSLDLSVEIVADPRPSIWQKVAFNAVLNPLCAIARIPVGGLPMYDDWAELAEAVLDEVIAVAAADDVDLPRAPILQRIQRQPLPDVAGGHLPSMLVDVLRGRPTEIAALNGAITAEGDRLGVPTPVNRTIAQLVQLITATSSARVPTERT